MDDSSKSESFTWKTEHDELLEKLATSDYEEVDWNELRNMIIYKLKENIALFMADPPPSPPPVVPSVPSSTDEQPTSSPNSSATVTVSSPKALLGAKFPPFPRRDVNDVVRKDYNSFGRSKAVLTEEEAKEMSDGIEKLLGEFDGPPFTVQRICELVWRPRLHYKKAGKYLRAVERTLLVTSIAPEFPVIPPEDKDGADVSFSPAGSLREARTPLFSPIPFLHEDARQSRSRSHSRSPPMSPLQLPATAPATAPDELRLGDMAVAVTAEGGSVVDGPVIGLVDELDDPGPGHMSDHPTALTAVTSTAPAATEGGTGAASQTSAETKPMFGGSLEERFVRGEEKDSAMAVEEPDEDKENVPKP